MSCPKNCSSRGMVEELFMEGWRGMVEELWLNSHD